MRLYIIGMPGTGKTYFGRQLGSSLKLNFFDLDHAIEKKENLTIKEIIHQKGETYFRTIEHEVLKTISKNSHCVISCGGGTPMFFNNMEGMKSSGIVIWINTDLNIISKRISNNISRRPLFIGLTEDEILTKIKKIYQSRKKIYAKADIFIDSKLSKTESLNVVIQKVMKISQRRLR